MFYQENEIIKLFKFKVIYDTVETFTNNKEEFENNLKKKIELENEMRKKFTNELGLEEIEFPKVTYENVSLTEEEEKRFEYIKNIVGITLDEVYNFVVNNIEPANPNYQIMKLEEENTSLKLALAEKDSLDEQALTDIQLAIAELASMIGGE